MDDKIFKLIKKEEKRQQETLMMIPSENVAWPEVRKAVGSILMHKYSEGQPGKRYYEGNEVIDEIENLAKKRALKAFGLGDDYWEANIQALSGAPANISVFNALLEPGDKILSLYLPDGGHLSHGWQMGLRKITLVSKIYDVHFYHVDPKTGKIDYKELAKLIKKIKPKMLVSGGTSYPFQIKHKDMSTIAKSVGAYYLADIAHEAGLIIAKANISPFPFADVVTMTTHKTLRGPRGAIIIGRKEVMSKVNASIFPGIQGGPHNHTIAGIAIALKKAKTVEFTNHAFQTIHNAKRLGQKLIEHGFTLAGGTTEKHLIVVDMASKKINGHIMARAMARVGIVVNKNTVPGDTLPPLYPSGIRMGTPVITLRALRYKEIDRIAEIVSEIADHIGEYELSRDTGLREIQLEEFEDKLKNDKFYKKLRSEILEMCKNFPLKF